MFDQLVDDYIKDGKVQFVYIPYLSRHTGASESVRASLCALEQGKFWEMHDILFDLFKRYGGSAYTQARLTDAANTLEMDTPAFLTCVFTSESDSMVMQAASLIDVWRQEGTFTGTPTVYLNGEHVSPAGTTLQAVEEALKEIE